MYRKKELLVIVLVQIAIVLVLTSAQPNHGLVELEKNHSHSIFPYRR